MPTLIELHLLSYFTFMLFVFIATKMFLKTKANLLVIFVASLMFAIIKFLLDFFECNMLLQAIVIVVYVCFSSLVVHKLNHISKLIVSGFVCGIYYLCLAGINWFLTVVVLNGQINYISNFYLVSLLGLNFILFSIFCVVLQYFKAKNPINLTQRCVLTINNSKIPITGFLDTGNALKDCQSGQSVVIVCIDAIKKYITNQMYADLIFATNASGMFEDIKKIKYATISGTNYLTAFKPKQFVVNGKIIDCYVGITLKAMEYDALLGASCI